MVPRRHIPVILLTLLAAAGIFLLDLLMGDSGFGMAEGVILEKIRLPRVAMATLVGAALGLGGAQMQAVFRNPLADPHIMGISSGAGLGAAVAVLALPGLRLGLPVGAVLGALLTTLLVVAAVGKTRSTATLLLLGIMMGFILSAVSATLQYTADEESLKRYYSWAAGSFVGNGPFEAVTLAVCLGLGAVLARLNARGLDLLLFGDDFAAAAGGRVRRIRLLSLLGVCLMTGTATAFCGPIGFAGIAAPHVARWIGGAASARVVLPLSALCGAGMALLADFLSFSGPVPIPVGSTMALVGIPVILYILLKKR